MSERFLVPGFVKKVDEKLLRNKPAIWSTRAHLVLWFAGLFILGITLLCYFSFSDTRVDHDIYIWVIFISMIAILGFVFWLIFLLRFNVFKRYGNWSAGDGLIQFILYFVSILMMVGICFIPSAVLSFRANQQYSYAEITHDVNKIIRLVCNLEYDLLPKAWDSDTNHIVADYSVPVPETKNHSRLLREVLTAEIAAADSVIKVNDSLYIFFTAPDYQFVSPYFRGYGSSQLLSSAELYREIIQGYRRPDRKKLTVELENLLEKYEGLKYYSSSTDSNEKNYKEVIGNKYRILPAQRGLDNITSAKAEWTSNWTDYCRALFYTSFFFTLLVFAFRHSTVRTFFMTLLTIVLLTIFSGLMISFSSSTEVGIYIALIGYFIMAAILAVLSLSARSRKATHGIGINILFLLTPFIPLVISLLKIEMDAREMYNEANGNYYNMRDYSWLYLAEIGGIVFFLIILQPVFKKLYRNWYASPEG